MNKKITSLIITLILPAMLLVGCKNNQDEFYMTEETTAMDNSVEYSANTYKEAFFSTKNYSNKFLQDELYNIIGEIKDKKEKTELIDLLSSYLSGDNSDITTIKSIYEKYNVIKQHSDNSELESRPLYEISSRLYKATLNATKKHYDINDFYIYYKNELAGSSETGNELDNKIKMTAIKEYTIANIYKTAYNDSFIGKLITVLESKNENMEKEEEKVVIDKTDKEENNTEEVQKPSDNYDDEKYPEYLELTEVVKSQIYDAGVNSAIEFIGLKPDVNPSEYAKSVYDALESDNSLGDKKEEGFNSFLNGFKTTLQNNGIEYK